VSAEGLGMQKRRIGHGVTLTWFLFFCNKLPSAKPDKADDLLKLLVEFVAGARKGPGCKHTSLLEDRKQAAGSLLSKPGPIRRRSKPT
jgi:hypothetical protein